MGKFFLKTKDGDVINYITQKDEILAIKYFCKMKKLSREDLLRIFKIEKELVVNFCNYVILIPVG